MTHCWWGHAESKQYNTSTVIRFRWWYWRSDKELHAQFLFIFLPVQCRSSPQLRPPERSCCADALLCAAAGAARQRPPEIKSFSGHITPVRWFIWLCRWVSIPASQSQPIGGRKCFCDIFAWKPNLNVPLKTESKCKIIMWSLFLLRKF